MDRICEKCVSFKEGGRGREREFWGQKMKKKRLEEFNTHRE